MTEAPAVELSHVNKTFSTGHFFSREEGTGRRRLYHKKYVHAVRDVSFSVSRGEVFGLLGPNGAGKTTTVKMVSGLVRSDSGSVRVDGLDVKRKRLKVLRKIGVVLEGTRTCIWPLTPMENLAYFGNLRDVRGKLLKERSRYLLDFIGLSEKADIQVRRLSRGQKQKLAICIALITDPPVILLDEPTTGLDVQSSRAIKDKIIQMTREQGKCALVTTHDMGVAQELCDRIGIINKGQLAACKPTEDLLDVFSDHTYEYRVDRLPDVAPLAAMPGVLDVSAAPEGDSPGFLLLLSPDERERSDALYASTAYLRDAGCLLRSVTKRSQTLENVFLRITSEHSDSPVRSGDEQTTVEV